jgi:hypothetical protein
MKAKTTEQFIIEAKEVHGDKYDYSKVKYSNKNTKVCVICPEHGEFWQRPSDHLAGRGCPECGRKRSTGKKITTVSFIKEAKEIHENKYDYSKVEYRGALNKICIICPEHGEFWQRPSDHLAGRGCPECAKKKMGPKKYDNNVYIEKCKIIHGNKYDYSKLEYKGSTQKVCVICPKHGKFWIEASHHLQGYGCPMCSKEKILEESRINFIERSKKIHFNKYDYSKCVYNGWNKKVKIICPKHGEFKQLAGVHVSGGGCPKCNSSKLEEMVRKVLTENSIDFEEQYTSKIFGEKQNKLICDFYIKNINCVIECQGIQHFQSVDFFGGYKGFIKTKKRDFRKLNICKKNNIKIIYFTNLDYETFLGEKVFHTTDELLNEIKKAEK